MTKKICKDRETPPRCKTFLLILASLFPLIVTGCVSLGQPSHRIDYYTLDYEPPQSSGQKHLPIILQVQRFSSSPEYSTDKIIYQQQNYSRAAYTYHRWRATPADLATYFITRDLQHSELFKAVMPPTGLQNPTYSMEGIVDYFLEEDRQDGWYARIQITCTLVKTGEADVSKRIIFQKPFSAEAACEKNHPMAVVKAMSLAMADLSRQLSTYTANTIR